MTRRTKPSQPKKACKCPVDKPLPLSTDADGYKIYYRKEHMEFRKPDKESRNVRH